MITSMKRNVILLALCQAMLITAMSLQISVSALVGQAIAGPALATIPLGLLFLGNMLTTFPASFYMKRFGRRAGFMTGALLGMAGAVLAVYAVAQQHFMLFCAANLLLGTFNGFGQFYRFAAADVSTAEYRSRAIAYVLAGGVLAAVIGPNLAAFTRTSFSVAFLGSYGALIGVFLLSLAISSLLNIPKPGVQELDGPKRPLGKIALQPIFLVAVIGAMVGYGVMNLMMTATPLAMEFHRHTFESTALVIQWHILAMFVPSFFTGHLIRWMGVLNVMLAGALVLLGAVAVNLSGVSVHHFTWALILLGLGWNFLYIGGTTLLTDSYWPAEKAKAQALNDFLVFTTVTCTALGVGAIHRWFGWEAINLGVVPLILITMIVTLWLLLQRRASGRRASGKPA